jgi:hypothetical protein
MATAQRPPVKSGSVPQYESFVEQQIHKASRRLRILDAVAWSLLLGAGLLTYGLVMSLADLLWQLPTGIRLAAWCLLVIGVAAALGSLAMRLLTRRVNPHFVARQLEQTLPDAKNSVINWLDLRDQPLAPVIRGSLGRRAAQDLTHADTERAISARRVGWLAGVAGVLFLVQIGWLIASPAQVASLLQRAFFPFDLARIAKRTSLTLLKPQGGDVSVATNQPVVFQVQVSGYEPTLNQKDSLKLHFRYQPGEPFEERALTRDVDGTWTTSVLADQVRNGFWYKITGGDARLPEDREYRVDVKTIPAVVRFETHFKYRDYLKRADKKVVYDKNVWPRIKELRGTEATLIVHASRAIKSCVLELKTTGAKKRELIGEPVAGSADAWRFAWVLDQPGEFRVLFTTQDGEENKDRKPCAFEVDPDKEPTVVMTQPAKDVTLPANGALVVEGFAEDDHGVKSMELHLRVVSPPGQVGLKPKAYRPDTPLQLPNGRYPRRLDYSDYVFLDELQTVGGEPFAVKQGMELEYWIEARDNCDYSDKAGNRGVSKVFKVTITAPDSADKAAGQRGDAQKGVKQKQGQQDRDLDAQRQQAQAQQDAANKDPKQGSGDLAGDADKVKQAMEKADGKGAAKGADQDQGGAKEQGPGEGGKGKDTPPDPKDQAGKPKGSDSQASGAGQGKDKGDNSPNPQGSAKDQGQPDPSKQPPGAAKGDEKSNPASEAKDAPPKDGASSAKDKAADAKAGEGKDAADGMPGAQGDKKGAGDGADAGAAKKKDDGKAGGTDTAKSKDGPPPGGSGDVKGGPPPDAKADLAKDKGSGAKDGDRNVQVAPSEMKGGAPTDKAGPKEGPTRMEQVADAKGGDPTNKPPPPDAKFGPPKSADAAGTAKGGDRKDASLDDVAKLREQLSDSDLRELAEKALEKIKEQAQDPKVQQAAEKAIEEHKNDPAQAKKGGPETAGDKTPGTKSDPKDGGAAGAKSAKSDSGPSKSKDNGPGKTGGTAKSDPKKPGSGNFGKDNTGTVGEDDPGKASPVDDAAARRLGELQLETLKKQIDQLRKKFTPEVMKELKWTDAQREDFLKRMMADALLRAEKQKLTGEKLPPPGSIQGLLPGGGPRTLGGGNGPPGSVGESRPEAPPEVRETLRILQKKQ